MSIGEAPIPLEVEGPDCLSCEHFVNRRQELIDRDDILAVAGLRRLVLDGICDDYRSQPGRVCLVRAMDEVYKTEIE